MFRINNKGFTIGEVICAVAIFAVASVIMLNGFLLMLRMNRAARDIVTTTDKLNEYMDVTSKGTTKNSYNIVVFKPDGSTTTVPYTGNYQSTKKDKDGNDLDGKRARFNSAVDPVGGV